MKEYFYLEESVNYPNRYLIRLHHDLFRFPSGISGSFNILIARVLGVSYPDYLRYVRENFGAELVGVGHKYVLPYFENSEKVRIFVNGLNKRMDTIYKNL